MRLTESNIVNIEKRLHGNVTKVSRKSSGITVAQKCDLRSRSGPYSIELLRSVVGQLRSGYCFCGSGRIRSTKMDARVCPVLTTE